MLKVNPAEVKPVEFKQAEVKPDEAKPSEAVKPNPVKAKPPGIKGMRCLLCKEKPEVEMMEFTRTQLLGHLTNNHFSKELNKDYGDCVEGDDCTFCLQDQKTPVFKIK